MNEYKPEILNIAEICFQKGVEYVVISPGSRSAPLTLAFLRHKGLKCLMITDERSAAFTALGISQQTGKPTVLICTSGTAVLNYAPAVTEAFYQQIPLLVLTADRPPEWTDQFDNQSIRQNNIYNNHIIKSFSLPVDTLHNDDKWYFNRVISEAINISTYPQKGPVHINVPLREPLYPNIDDQFNYQKEIKLINLTKGNKILDDSSWNQLIDIWSNSENILILAGMNKQDKNLESSLKKLNDLSDAVLIADVNSNLGKSLNINHSDIILSNVSQADNLKADLLITFGGPILSKSTKNFLKRNKPKYHWHIQSSGLIGDTYQSLTDIIDVNPEYFFKEITNRITKIENKKYQSLWLESENSSLDKLTNFMNNTEQFNEFKSIYMVINKIPDNSLFQIANSMTIRYINYISLNNSSVIINSNRGTSGIDGSISTAVGACIATGKITTLITGDLSFFYDRNGLWNNQLPNNLRIIVMNNHGGGIFRLIDGPAKLPELDDYFETVNKLNIENTAKDFDLEYFKANSYQQIEQILTNFFEKSDKSKILEIETNSKINFEVFEKFKSIIK